MRGRMGQKRTYRKRVAGQPGWSSFNVRYLQSDLWIQADLDARQRAETLLLEARRQLEIYALRHPAFMTAYSPMAFEPEAPEVVRWMLRASKAAQVGPMASVAGAIARYVGEGLLAAGCTEVVVENGGDLYLKASRALLVGLLAGDSPLSGKMGLRIDPAQMPMGVATSSATVGHSWSQGMADAACVLASDAALADAVATAMGNMVKEKADLEAALQWALSIEGVLGGLVILGSTLASAGSVELVRL
ncbi:MAG: UPF0280 family protein [Thermodesulfobacteriota bacterium]